MRANVEDRGMKGDCTPLMEAASAGHTDIVKLLIGHCADVNAQSSSGEIWTKGVFKKTPAAFPRCLIAALTGTQSYKRKFQRNLRYAKFQPFREL